MVDDRPAAADDVQPDEAIDGEPPRPPSEPAEESPFRRWRANLPLMLMIVLAVLVAGGAFTVWNQNRDLRAERDEQRDAARVASDFTTAVLGYDFRHLRGSVDDVLELSTPDWGREYENAWFEEQQPIVQETHARAEVAVDDVMVGEEANGVLPVVVTFDATIHSTIGARRLQGSYLRVDLTKVDGRWRVDDMLYLGQEGQDLTPNGGGGGDGGTPTPTTTP